jgi:hypothetical protein
MLARHEREFTSAGEARLALDELLGALDPTGNDSGARCRALARLLSGTGDIEGATAELRGAFAAGRPAAGLTGGKDR